jgi:hypothetical protein
MTYKYRYTQRLKSFGIIAFSYISSLNFETTLVKHFGNGALLLPMDDPWQTMEAGLAAFEPGFELQRDQPDQQTRPAIQP